ncbi:Rha family transcriptional regulator [Methylocystis sp. ATCC 49242]|uniref:Rha family transcriptional regulator n=1 Tax=Methylocystis sp. ATCC 49242 TaxID=622637 RepID=UPI003528AA59
MAEKFGKRHSDVLRDVDTILTNADLRSSNWFRETDYLDVKGESRRSFDLTRQGVTLLVMGRTGKERENCADFCFRDSGG